MTCVYQLSIFAGRAALVSAIPSQGDPYLPARRGAGHGAAPGERAAVDGGRGRFRGTPCSQRTSSLTGRRRRLGRCGRTRSDGLERGRQALAIQGTAVVRRAFHFLDAGQAPGDARAGRVGAGERVHGRCRWPSVCATPCPYSVSDFWPKCHGRKTNREHRYRIYLPPLSYNIIIIMLMLKYYARAAASCSATAAGVRGTVSSRRMTQLFSVT